MRLAEVIGTLSLATDAGTGVPEEHGLCAAIVAAKLGGAAPYYLALLRYAGCTSEGHVAGSLFGDEVQFGTETYGMDYGNPREVMPAALRAVRKGKGALGGVVAMARAFPKFMQMTGVMKAHCEVASVLAGALGFDDAFRAAIMQISERWNGSGMP